MSYMEKKHTIVCKLTGVPYSSYSSTIILFTLWYASGKK